MAVGEYYTSSVVALCVGMCERGAAWLCRVSWMDEHTDVDDGRRASVSLALSAAGHARRISQFPLGSASDTDAEKAYDSRSRYGRWRSPEGAGITRDRRGMSGVTSDQPVWAVDMGIDTFFTRDWTARDERDPPRAFCGRRANHAGIYFFLRVTIHTHPRRTAHSP